MESIGREFRAARERKEITLSQAAAATRIKIQHLESMEGDDFSQMAAAAYARGFIKIYAEYLDLEPEPLIHQYTQAHAPQEVTSVLVDDSVQTPVQPQAEGVGDGAGDSWLDRAKTTGLVRRILLPVAAIVGVVLALSVVIRLIQGGDREQSTELLSGDDVVSPLLGNPPDAYLELERQEDRQP